MTIGILLIILYIGLLLFAGLKADEARKNKDIYKFIYWLFLMLILTER